MLYPPVSQYQYNVYVQNIISKLRAEMLRRYFKRKRASWWMIGVFFYFLLFHDCSVILMA